MNVPEWMQNQRASQWPWMDDFQFECWRMFCDLMGGAHHVYGRVKPAGPNGITISEFANGWSTFDFDKLTRAVVMAHDRCIRLEISPSNMQNLRFYLHKRKREGEINQRHPTLEDAIAKIRG